MPVNTECRDALVSCPTALWLHRVKLRDTELWEIQVVTLNSNALAPDIF